MKQKSITLMLLLLVLSIFAHGQTIQITGEVTHADNGNTIPGANVQIKGTLIGTTTDANGQYTIEADAASVLVFSFIGLETREVPVEGRSIVNVALEPSSIGLEEVVVQGYGVQRRSTYTGAATTVDASDRIEQIPVTSFDKALQGAVPGMQVTGASGQPGSNTQIVIRGIGSINAGTQPLYVIDGVPMITGDQSIQSSTANALSNLNPNDIESIQVLRDASATAIYGSRASNGVILITTKRGSEGKTNFSFRTQQGFSTRTSEHFDVLNAEEYKMLTNEGYVNAGLPEDDFADFEGIDEDWLGNAFVRNARTQSYEFSANGGTDRTQFFVSASYFEQEGIAISSYLDRLTFRSNIDHQANDFISFGANIGLSNTGQGTPLTDAAYFTSPVTGGFLLPPIYPIKDSLGDWNMSYPALGGVNFVANNTINDHDSETRRLIGNGYVQLDFMENLIFKSNIGIDYLDMAEQFYDDPRAQGNTAFERGRATASMTKRLVYNIANTLNWDQSFNRHNISVLLGHEAQADNYEDFLVASEDFASFLLRRLSSGATPVTAAGTGTMSRLLSVFTQSQYTYDNTYYATFSFRRDGSSRFGRDYRFANFFSVGGSWRISQEDFLQNFDWLTNAMIRGSYGTSGNSQIGNFSSLALYGYGFDYFGRPGSSPVQFENSDLQWERGQVANLGLDLRLFDRINLTAEVYNRRTTNLLLFVPLSSTAGITSQLRNAGEMQNQGLEIILSADITDPRVSEFLWNVDFNVSFNQNEVLSLVDDQDQISFYKLLREGQELGTWYMEQWAGVNPADGSPMWYDEEGNVTFNRNLAERVIVGSSNPDFIGGITNSLSYKGFFLTAFFTFTYGNMLYDDTYRILASDGAFSGFNQSRDQLDRWTEPGQITDTPKRVNGNASQSNERSTRNLYDGSYMRLKNAQLGYNLPENWLSSVRLSSARIYIQGQNLLTWTNYPGMDPEQGIDGDVWFVYPNARTFTFGVDVNF